LDPSTLLSQLRDIHAPEPISIWPLAIGWWLLIILSTVVITSLCYFILRKRLQKTWKRQAIKAFQTLSSTYIQQPSTENLLQINRLLKQALSSAKNDRSYLHLCEAEWASALQAIKYKETTILYDPEINILSSDIYSRQIPKLDSAALDRISLWIKHLG
tara:strand:- start:1717 stop:2193 length:477 start_codon:yes stop_codon:yes gene_type:complete